MMSKRNNRPVMSRALAEQRRGEALAVSQRSETKAMLDGLIERQYAEVARLLAELDDSHEETAALIEEVERRAVQVIEELNKGARN